MVKHTQLLCFLQGTLNSPEVAFTQCMFVKSQNSFHLQGAES